MEQEQVEKKERVLLHNNITQFILRIDVQRTDSINLAKLADSLSVDYMITKREIVNNIKVNIDNSEASIEKCTNYHLDSGEGVLLSINADNSINLQSTVYETNKVYKERLSKIIDNLIKQNGQNVNALRIGMRYINNFPSEKINSIHSYIAPQKAKIVKGMLQKANTSRAIAIEEYVEDSCNIRVQYGIPNLYYPSIIRRFDVMLDIDVFANGLQNISDWADSISIFNHTAYDTFISYMNPSYIEKMK